MTKTQRVIIVGSGPGGMAAAIQLRNRAADQVAVLLFEQDQASEFLPGTIATALGQTLPTAWQQPLSPAGITVRHETVSAVSGQGVELMSGERVKADAVIAAPGLALDLSQTPEPDKIHAFWSPTTAQVASQAVLNQQAGTVVIAISALPYRCPPAPYSLAMQLAGYYRQEQRDIQIILTTPEDEPLGNIGGEVPAFLQQSCTETGIEVHSQLTPILGQTTDTHLHYATGETIRYDLALIIPPHTRSSLLKHLPGEGPLVPVSSQFESEEAGLFVIGDAAMTPLPRAADAAAAQGRTAADAILAKLGIAPAAKPHIPTPECYIGHGNGVFSRIKIRFPHGLPPAGKPVVTLDQPTADLAAEFAQAFANWQTLRRQ